VQERALLIELEQAAQALEETLSALGAAGRSRGTGLDELDFSGRRGRLPLPVDAEIAQRFGRVVDSEFLTQTFRKGVEFGVEMGDAVRSVAPGEVRFADWFRGYGRIVILDHGDRYFTVYGHLSEISVELGDSVEEEQLLGRAGETGSLTGPSLYFEIRRGSEPLDPAEWLGPG
jgi:septal ring factor EnvC (AmiA/AmiB activator)